MDIRTLEKFHFDTIERVYKLVDELSEISGSTDIKVVSNEVKRISRAISAELEGMDESVKEYHNI